MRESLGLFSQAILQDWRMFVAAKNKGKVYQSLENLYTQLFQFRAALVQQYHSVPDHSKDDHTCNLKLKFTESTILTLSSTPSLAAQGPQ